jgi:hypothetical protein
MSTDCGAVGNPRSPPPLYRFTSKADVLKAFANAPSVGAKRFFLDVDAILDQDPTPRGRSGCKWPARHLPTCVLIDIENVDSNLLPDQMLITTISLAELAAGPHATNDPTRPGDRRDES